MFLAAVWSGDSAARACPVRICFVKRYRISQWQGFLRWPGLSAVLLTMAVLLPLSPRVNAAFGTFLPLSYSGQVTYNYSYAANAGNESETTGLLTGISASGYIWQPWFATTSLSLNVGLANTETTSSSSDATTATGGFTLGIFPRSRFPFSMAFSRSDSRSESYYDLTQVSGETSHKVTRWSLRQSYRPRSANQLYNAWYYFTKFDAEGFGSESTNYGLDYQLRHTKQTLTLGASHSDTNITGSSNEPTTDVFSVNHVYTPSGELGVNTLGSYVETDPGSGSGLVKDSQAYSSFYWRPEHRSLNVSGGVRLAETRTEGFATTVSRSLNTNIGFGYRLTRSLNFSASASLGTADSNNTQSLSTTQGASLAYTGRHYQFDGFSYSWQWSTNASNSTTRTDSSGVTSSTDRQSLGGGIGHNLGKSWNIGRFTSLSASFSQSLSGSKNSEIDAVTKTFNNAANLSWNRRGRRGSTYANMHGSDSRTYSENDSVFQEFGAGLVQDLTINRLSSVSGNLNYQASESEAEDSLGGVITGSNQNLAGSLAYRHDRPFGIYNLRFTSNLIGSKQLNSEIPTTTLRWESIFRYSLGLLSTSLSFRLAESAGGNLAKSMNFQATRSF